MLQSGWSCLCEAAAYDATVMGLVTTKHSIHSFTNAHGCCKQDSLLSLLLEFSGLEVCMSRGQSAHCCAAGAVGQATSAHSVSKVHAWMLLKYLCVLGGSKDVIKLLFQSLPI